jgi:uncharacterized protein YxjI
MIDPNAHDRFVLRQRIRLAINQYEFSLPGGENTPFCFVEQKRFKFKEDIGFFADSSKSQMLLRIKARTRFDPRAKYDITTADGTPIGQISKVFGTSLFRSTYALHDVNGGEICRATERKLWVALVRRIVHAIPFVESVANWIPIPYHFDFVRNEQILATNTRRRMKLRDTYDIDASPDTGRLLDRRLLLAAVVGMDALQAR